jgi:hypothetical protein
MKNGMGGVGVQAAPKSKTTLFCMRLRHINMLVFVILYVGGWV